MPNRILKEGIRTSKNVNALSDFQFRVWVYLITYVDDYGCGSADPEILKGFVFPRRKGVTENQIQTALADLAMRGMILLYEVDGESYFAFPNWRDHQRIQAKKHKFPEPADGELRKVTVSHGESPSESESKSNPNPNPNPNPKNARGRARVDTVQMFLELSQGNETIKPIEDVVIRWIQYKDEKARGKRGSYTEMGMKSLITQIENRIRLHGAAAVADCIVLSMSNNWEGIIWEKINDPHIRRRRGNEFDVDEYIRSLEEEEARNAEVGSGKAAEVP